ncbi:DUF3017 domain-containing protein [Aeromicrobium sp. UC242_57]|uniref:DUF3017 domain-containing protein n=1 Tax=Aeromicrobium sp. UC242_57 TaxID=3374624 RepID=UPI0037A52F12
MRGPRSRGSQLYLLQLLTVAVGLVLVAVGLWRTGIIAIGVAFMVGAVARSVVPIDHTGMLRVRGRCSTSPGCRSSASRWSSSP